MCVVDVGIMVLNGYFKCPKSVEVKSCYYMQFTVIPRTPLPLERRGYLSLSCSFTPLLGMQLVYSKFS